jgi:pectate lyase
MPDHEHRLRRPRAVVTAVLLLAAACSGDDPVAVTDGVTVTVGTLPRSVPTEPPAQGGTTDAGTTDAGTVPGSAAATVPATTGQTSTSTTVTPAEVAVQLDIEPQFLGFAGTQGLTGGAGHPVVVVTSADDSGPGSYREALSGGQRVVRFDPALAGETIHLQEPVEATGSDLTLDGSGVDVTVSGHATRFSGTNIVVAGMTFVYNDDVDEDDAITFRDASETQVAGLFGNHFERGSDGLVDVIWNRGHDVYVTMCGNSFSHHDKAVLINSGDDDREGGRYFVTMCHNTWTDVYQRMPLSRRAQVHQFNSLFERYGQPDGHGGGSKAGGDGESRSEHLLEHNIAIPRASGETTFDGTVVTQPRSEWAGIQLESDAAVRSVGSLLGSVGDVSATEVTTMDDEVFTPPYEYPLVGASVELAAVLRATAGTCLPVAAERVSPCAPLVLVDDREASLDVLVDGGTVVSVAFAAGSATVDAQQVEPGRWRVPVAALGNGPVEVRASVHLEDGRVIASDVAIIAVVP